MTPPLYVPAHYVPRHAPRATFWTSDGVEPLACELVHEGLAAIEQALRYELNRSLHVVVYASNAEARLHLDRNVEPTALLAPLHTEELALVALHAASVAPENADRRRRRRHLDHELAHVFIAQRTGSTKQLGDGDRGMRVESWVNEGFAENVAAVTANRPDVIERALQRCAAGEGHIGSAAATASVWRAVNTHGLEYIFAHLDAPDRFLVEE